MIHKLISVALLMLMPVACFAQAPAPLVVPYQYSIPIASPGCCVGYGVPYIQTLPLSPSQFQVPVVNGIPSRHTSPYVYEGVYTLSFDVQSYFCAFQQSGSCDYPGWIDVEIYFGLQKLCEYAGFSRSAIQTISIPCGSPGYIVVDQTLPIDNPQCVSGSTGCLTDAYLQAVQPFQVTWAVPGWQVAITNVQFTWTQDR